MHKLPLVIFLVALTAPVGAVQVPMRELEAMTPGTVDGATTMEGGTRVLLWFDAGHTGSFTLRTDGATLANRTLDFVEAKDRLAGGGTFPLTERPQQNGQVSAGEMTVTLGQRGPATLYILANALSLTT